MKLIFLIGSIILAILIALLSWFGSATANLFALGWVAFAFFFASFLPIP